MPQWKFSAARRDGQATASTIVAPVLFLVEPPQEPSKTGDSYPVAIHRVPPMYPFKARQYGVTGEVLLHLIVGADGVPTKVKAVHSTHRLFADAAVEAVGKWRFKPGKANGKPVASSMVQPMTFSLGDEPSVSQPLKIKQDPSKLAKLPPELQWDVAPEYLPINPAVYPFEAYAAKKEGSAQFAFVVGPTGKIVERQTVKATGPEFEGAARAMLDTFKLRPASKNGRPSSALLGLTIEFQLKGNGLVQIDDETREVMKRLSEHRDTFVNAEALTHPLVPLSHLGPVFPSDVTDVSSGEAVIEFVISRTGAALLPKVISATSPSFGYAAAQAVGSWQFEAPVKDTKVVEVITRETVTFTRKK
jgi:TonB family protein